MELDPNLAVSIMMLMLLVVLAPMFYAMSKLWKRQQKDRSGD